jgi:hypothetical protein
MIRTFFARKRLAESWLKAKGIERGSSFSGLLTRVARLGDRG